MLFNNNNNGQQELKGILGYLYASNDFTNIKTEIILAEEDITKLIGQEVYDIANAHYWSNNYNKEYTVDQTQLTVDDTLHQLLDQLVHKIQQPVALNAYLDYAPNSDLIHDNNGRRIAFEEHTQVAREWQIDRSEQSILSKTHRSTDRLIEFLDNNPTDTGWEDTPAYKQARKLFIRNAATFNQHFPINTSRRLLLVLAPFMRTIEKRHIKPALTAELYTTIKTELLENDTTTHKEIIEEYIIPTIVPLTMAMAAKRLPVKILPQGIIQNYTSDRQTKRATTPANQWDRAEVAQQLQQDGEKELLRLNQYIETLNATDDEPAQPIKTITQRNPSTNKHFRV